MADEFLTKFYLGLADVLSASVLTPREKKLIEIINKQNAALETIAASTLTKSPQEIANLAKGATVVIAEKGEAAPTPTPAPAEPGPPLSAKSMMKLVDIEAPTTVTGGMADIR